jgi:hypothetical protein
MFFYLMMKGSKEEQEGQRMCEWKWEIQEGTISIFSTLLSFLWILFSLPEEEAEDESGWEWNIYII